ncbi:hypothetical protein PL263_00845 [Methylomonas sp. EFPC3]|uniref:hypothetical protein n=1 Tax=Methylomonas sp. EFPC3 TaxID=3021710 RepID=UPI00241692CF|nr:hypothetical protein [Methylomonas sp. EFPC3]WFP50585.1 hypothetical protein PL263_00845 [Methylomonas sp. EFPC3]
MCKKTIIAVLSLAFSSAALADHEGWGHRWGHHHHHHHDYYPEYRERVIYYQPAPPPVVEYVPEPSYYAPPPRPRYDQYDQRNPQGLLGGMVGSAMGYHFGGGDPLAAGIGAAAGALLGNGMY